MQHNWYKVRTSFVVILCVSIGVFLLSFGMQNVWYSSNRDNSSPQDTSELFVEDVEESQIEVFKTLHFGDAMLGRGVGIILDRGVNPFENIAPFIEEGNYDEVVLNLEGPFTHSTECQIKPYSFRFDPQYIGLLKDAGVTAVTTANNHSNDCFVSGAEENQILLEDAGIRVFGDDTFSLRSGGRVFVSEKTQSTFFGFDTTMGLQTASDIVSRVEGYADPSQRKIVHMHWGEEYQSLPNSHQESLAEELVRSGASLIIGHHPHVVQPVKIIDSTPVFYSLGNFIFDQDTLETQTGYAVEEVVRREGGSELREYSILPYRLYGYVPSLLEGPEKEKVCSDVLSFVEEHRVGTCAFSLETY